MLSSLKHIQKENEVDGQALHAIWHDRMEKSCDRSYRQNFFSNVVTEAEKACYHILVSFY